MAESTVMSLTHFLLLVLTLCSSFSSAKKVKVKPGCRLEVTEHVGLQKEMEGWPLVIFVDLMLLGVRDVPDSGGSYAMDVK